MQAWLFFATTTWRESVVVFHHLSSTLGFSGDPPGKVRVHLVVVWVIVNLARPVLGAPWMLSAAVEPEVLEQTGTVLVPAPRLRAVASTKVHVPFPAEFTHLPRVLVTPLTRSPGPLVTPQLCTTTLNVTVRGFDMLVERYDERFPWLGMTVLASWIAWDSTWTPEGQGGSVALVPPQKGSTSNVIEFPEPFDGGPPGVVVTARLEPDATPIVLAVSLQRVTQTYAIVNAFALGTVSKQGEPTGLVHVDWRAWPVSKDVAVLHNYEVDYARLDSPHTTIHLGKRYDNPPLILGTVLNAHDQSSAGTTQTDTFLVTVLNITNVSFEVNVAKVSDTSAWKGGVELAWVAQNSTKACPDDCLGHGICVGQQVCECDEGWTGNGTCVTCAEGHWGEECQSCIGYNSSSEAPLESVCSGHGVCDGSGSARGTGQCICEAAYAGGSCELCAEGSHRDLSNGECYICPKANNVTCTGHGVCEVSHNSSSEQGICICNATWAGPYCSVCQRGYAGSTCEEACVDLCNGRGDCSVDDLSGELGCHCDRGWSDAAHCGTCAEEYYGTACENACRDCGPHGSCDDGFVGSGNCTCEPGYESQQDCLACSWGYYHEPGADDLDFMCRECPGSAHNPCSGRGQPLGRCDGGRCICIAGYVGESCQHVSSTRLWALVLIILLAAIIFVGLSVLALSTWWKMRRLKTYRLQSSREIDRGLRKRLLEQCPELKGLEDALSALGSDPADWLIEYESLELGVKIGSGTSSVVFRGLYSDELVAIKRLHGGRCDPSTSAAFFRQEAELLCKLHHPHVVRFYGVCYHERDFYIVTEFCKDTLQQVLTTRRRNGTKLPVEELLRIATQVASGMAYLHSRHIVHRDLKPENVLLDDRGIVKLCDFGLSKLVVNDSQMTMQVGSPAYMSPEMADGSGMSESVDVYSFGILLWALYSCQNPYYDLDITPVQLLSRVVQGLRPQMDSEMLSPLAQLMRSCWAADPTQRPTFEQLVSDLRDLHREQSRRSETTTRSTLWSESSLEQEVTEEDPLISTV